MFRLDTDDSNWIIRPVSQFVFVHGHCVYWVSTKKKESKCKKCWQSLPLLSILLILCSLHVCLHFHCFIEFNMKRVYARATLGECTKPEWIVRLVWLVFGCNARLQQWHRKEKMVDRFFLLTHTLTLWNWSIPLFDEIDLCSSFNFVNLKPVKSSSTFFFHLIHYIYII